MTPRRNPALRPLEKNDLPALLELLEPSVPALELTPAALERNLFCDPGYRGDLLVAAERETGLAGAAVAALRRDGKFEEAGATPCDAVIKFACARKDPEGSALRAALLDELVERLRALGARRLVYDGAAPVYLQPGVPAADGETRAFLVRQGWRPIENRRSLVYPFEGGRGLPGAGAARTLPGGFTARRVDPDEAAWIEAEVRRAFGPAWAFETAAALRAGDAAVFAAVRRDGREERFAGFAVAGLWAANAFGPMGTAPESRGRGVGRALLVAALEWLRRKGVRRAVISWIGPEDFYRRILGPLETADYVLFAKELP